MNKSELIDAVAAQADIPKAVSSRAVTVRLKIITATLAKQEEVSLVGFSKDTWLFFSSPSLMSMG